MRILADENFPGDAVTALRGQGHDVSWVRSDEPGISDPQVLARAQAEDRILVTFDKDFGELAFRSGLSASSGVVLFRISVPSSPTSHKSLWQLWKVEQTGQDTLPSSRMTAFV